jgi:ketosteroid isomerase-like protein
VIALLISTSVSETWGRPVQGKGEAVMSSNVELFRMIIQRGFNEGDLSVANEICSPTLIEHEYLAKSHLPGPAILKDQIQAARAANPDLALSIEDIIEGGDKVWARLRATGTDPRTGKRVSFDVIDICRFEAGKLVEHWGVPDRFALLHQIGALPAPPNQ